MKLMCAQAGPSAKNKGSKRARVKKFAAGVKLAKQLMLHKELNNDSMEKMLKNSRMLRKGSLLAAVQIATLRLL